MKTTSSIAVIFLTLGFSLAGFVSAHAADPPPSPSGLTGQAAPRGFVKEWETEELKGRLLTYDGEDDPLMTRPGWAVMREDVDPDRNMYRFNLVHFAPDGRILRTVVLGEGEWLSRVSRDGHRFALTKGIFLEGYKIGTNRRDITTIVDNSGHTVKTLGENVYVLYLGPGGSLLITTGGDKGYLEVYDGQFKLLGAHGSPYQYDEDDMKSFVTVENRGIIAIIMNDYLLYVMDQRGNLLFTKKGINPGGFGHPTVGIDSKNGLVVLAGTVPEGTIERKYISLFDLQGNELWSKILWPDVGLAFEPVFQFSPNAKYIMAWESHNSMLLSQEGARIYSFSHRIQDQEIGQGHLTDDGNYIGSHTGRRELVLINKSKEIIDLGIARPLRGLLHLDIPKGLVLTQEGGRLIQRKLPNDLLTEVHQKGGIR